MIIDLKTLTPHQRLRVMRAKVGISAHELACYAGTTSVIISRFEHGRNQTVQDALKPKIAERLGVTVDELFGEVES